jgi:hypothetical protein
VVVVVVDDVVIVECIGVDPMAEPMALPCGAASELVTGTSKRAATAPVSNVECFMESLRTGSQGRELAVPRCAQNTPGTANVPLRCDMVGF